MSRVSYVGQNVVREHNGDWWYVVGPRLDDPLLVVKRTSLGATDRWLPVVSDDRGAIGRGRGLEQLQGTVTGPEYTAGLWNSSGLTGHAQSFNPRRLTTPGGIDTISTFRSRQYDPATGKWLQEDPIGVTGGVNLYQYNGNDPNSFSDPFGLCEKIKGTSAPCEFFAAVMGEARGASAEVKTAVANVIQNRANLVGEDYAAVVSQQGAFQLL